MLRFLMKRQLKDISGLEMERFYSIDGDLAALEAALRYGGYNEDTYDNTKLIGVEVLEELP